jgi:hypothetical protein
MLRLATDLGSMSIPAFPTYMSTPVPILNSLRNTQYATTIGLHNALLDNYNDGSAKGQDAIIWIALQRMHNGLLGEFKQLKINEVLRVWELLREWDAGGQLEVTHENSALTESQILTMNQTK